MLTSMTHIHTLTTIASHIHGEGEVGAAVRTQNSNCCNWARSHLIIMQWLLRWSVFLSFKKYLVGIIQEKKSDNNAHLHGM